MEAFSIGEIQKACGGRLHGALSAEACIRGVSIDSRSIEPGALFVPIAGERFDGHAFIAQALEKGAAAALCARADAAEALGPDAPLLLVEDTLAAFQALAGAYRAKFDIPFVGITGSVGKTTTKELIASVLAKRFVTLKNEGNLNGQTGVPLTLMRLTKEHEAAVIEMGMNHFGEMDAIAKLVRPTLCVFTNIADVHLEYLGSREGVLRAKCEMLSHHAKNAPIIVNGNDALLCSLRDRFQNVVCYGTEAGCEVYASDIEEEGLRGSRFIAHFPGGTLPLHIPAPGSYMVDRALCALAVGLSLGVPPGQIAAGIAAYKPLSGRMAIEKTPRFTLLNDAYNASPSSVAASIDIAMQAQEAKRRVLILGDMFELGKDELLYHRQIGSYAAEKGAELILCVGKLARAIHAGAKEAGGHAVHFEDVETLKEALPALLRDGDAILIKASNSMRLQGLVPFIRALP